MASCTRVAGTDMAIRRDPGDADPGKGLPHFRLLIDTRGVEAPRIDLEVHELL